MTTHTALTWADGLHKKCGKKDAEIQKLRLALDGIDSLVSSFLVGIDVISEQRARDSGVRHAKQVRELVRDALGQKQ